MPELPSDATDPQLLEQRVRRLEDSLAQLQDVRQLEDRITDRLTRRLISSGTNSGIVDQGARVADPPRALTTPAMFSHPSILHTDTSLTAHGLVLDMLAEARAMVRMYVDPRYNIGWFARLVPLAILAAILTSLIWIPGIHLMPEWVAQVISKLVDLVLAYFLFKILIREARRYRETAPDLPPSLRL
jgi:hypothetical protein